MTHNEVRRKYLDFFKKSPRSHKEIPSASLVPENDPTSLFTSSGMQPLIAYLLGEKHPLGTRLVDSQKCFRSQDIEEIGDNRHTTFFEMLGNWSLGDYFKKEQLPWIFEFLTDKNWLGLDPKRLYVSVFEGNNSVPKDTESITLWKKIFADVGIDAKENEKIFTYPATKNWWSRSGEPEKMPTGEPGGPDSEVFFDFGAELRIHEKSIYKDQKCHPNCDCGRFLEIANSVFMQYQKQGGGTLKELPNKNVDFGGGLERMVAATENEPDIFNTDIYQPIIQEVMKSTNKSYNEEENKSPLRIIADHIKAATFLIADGVEPSNKERGYILRRLLRRSAVKMHFLRGGLTPGFSSICEEVLRMYDGLYFDRGHIRQKVFEIVDTEMNRFANTLDKGLKVLKKTTKIDGKIAFDLYQTYGFPLEITTELFEEKGQHIDKDQFRAEFKNHQDLSRTAAKGMFKGGLQDQSEVTTRLHTATHLLQQALRMVLGNHIHQKGSNITAERLRFDFSHPTKLTPDEIKNTEELINKKIGENLKISMEIVDLDEAIKKGALTVPGASYPEKVKVYSAGDFSKEVCGGPHVDFTGSLGKFKIIKEEAAGAGVRRIYAILQS